MSASSKGMTFADESDPGLLVAFEQEYANLHREFGFIMIDAEQSICDQHQFIRETYEQYLTKPTIKSSPIPFSLQLMYK